jgi:F-type H+-transporting ATPase subunit epsilon
MAKALHLDIITPGKILFSGDVEWVELPGIDGEFQVLSGHTPFLTFLDIGSVLYQKGVEKTGIAISGGYCEVLPNKTAIFANSAEFAHEIDKARAEAALARAQQRQEEARYDATINQERARLALLRALNRLRIADMKK